MRLTEQHLIPLKTLKAPDKVLGILLNKVPTLVPAPTYLRPAQSTWAGLLRLPFASR